MRANGQGGGNGAAKGTGIRAKRRHMRAILKEGLEAALRADPEVLAKCKPKTMYGELVRGLVLEAVKCKATPLKTVMSLVDWEGDKGNSDELEAIADEQPLDWSADGAWLTLPEAETEGGEAAGEAEEPAKKELLRRLEQLMLGDEDDRKRAAAIVHAMHTGNFWYPDGGPAPPA